MTTNSTTNDASNRQLDRETICANCNVRLYQTADPNNIHWYHEGTGHVRCSTRFATPRSRVSDGGEVATDSPAGLIAYKWAETLSEGEQSVLLTSSLRRLRDMINASAATTDAKQEEAQGWQYTHERDAELIRRDGMMCEAHPGLEFGHDPDCGGPGMAWVIEGRSAIETFSATAKPSQPDKDAANEAANKIADYFNAPPSVIPAIEKIIYRVCFL